MIDYTVKLLTDLRLDESEQPKAVSGVVDNESKDEGWYVYLVWYICRAEQTAERERVFYSRCGRKVKFF